jgi:hypothetical protein
MWVLRRFQYLLDLDPDNPPPEVHPRWHFAAALET